MVPNSGFGKLTTSLLISLIFICAFYLLERIYVYNDAYKQHTEYYVSKIKYFKVPILIYHYVEYVTDERDTIRQSLDIAPHIFEEQIRTLKKAGYAFITPQDINEFLENKSDLPKKSVILSFDDGYEDFYTDVFPILKRENVRGVAYIVSEFLNKPNYMTGKQLAEVIESGLAEIGCHTANHLNLKHADIKTLEQEIGGCASSLNKDFGIKTVSFAYPFGAFNESAPSILKKYGFKNAVTTKSGDIIARKNIYEIPRIRPGVKVGQALLDYLEKTNWASHNKGL